MIERDARKFLATDAIRNATPGGCHAGTVKQGVDGARIVLRDVSTNRTYTLDNETDFPQKVLQVDCYAYTPSEAESIFQLVRNRMSGYRGDFGDGEASSVVIISEGQLPSEPEDSSDRWLHRYSAGFQMYYRETVPTHT